MLSGKKRQRNEAAVTSAALVAFLGALEIGLFWFSGFIEDLKETSQAVGKAECEAEYAKKEVVEAKKAKEVQNEKSYKRLLFIVSLTLIVSSCSIKCEPIIYKPVLVFQIAGIEVARELESVDYENHPHSWEWIGRIDKFKQEVELVQ